MPEEWSLPDQASVVYEYEAEGKRYTADTLQIRGNMQTTRSVRRERELLSRYPPGKSVLVYYNPAKPEEAVLQPGVPRGLLPLTAGGAVMFLVGLGIISIFTGAMKFPPGPLATGLAFLVPGLALILFALWSIWTVVASWHWPTTEAEVTHSEVVQGSESLAFSAESGLPVRSPRGIVHRRGDRLGTVRYGPRRSPAARRQIPGGKARDGLSPSDEAAPRGDRATGRVGVLFCIALWRCVCRRGNHRHPEFGWRMRREVELDR